MVHRFSYGARNLARSFWLGCVWRLQSIDAPNWIFWNFTGMFELVDTNLIRTGSEVKA